MFRKIALASILLSFVQILFGQSPGKPTEYEFVKDVDTSAEYPGGLPPLYADFQRETKYPVDARRKGIEGKTFIEFIVNSAGYIIPRSIQTLKGLYPSCDAEAIRVLKSSKTQWRPATKDGKNVNQKFVLPFAFSLTEAIVSNGPVNPVENPIKTIVIGNPEQSQHPRTWMVYGDPRMKIVVGTVSAGDSAVVTGWGPWSFFIETTSSRGYVSWKALKTSAELEKLSSVVQVQSTIQDSREEKLDKFAREIKPNAHLSMSASKKNIYVGECLTLTLAFEVNENNKAPLQFIDLGSQLIQIIPSLMPDHCFVTANEVVDVLGDAKMINNENFTTYPFYKASYCPLNSGTITIPAVTLNMARLKLSTREIDSLIAFASNPVVIAVNSLPTVVTPSGNDGYRMVGKFELIDSISARKVRAGELVPYTVTLSGDGLTFPAEPPEIKMPNVSAYLQDIIDDDWLVRDQLQSRKTFVYHLIFEKPGVYDFNGKIVFRYFNPSTKKIETIKSGTMVTVSNAVKNQPVKVVKIFGSKNNFIAVDASQSMQIEDYWPNRLGAVKMGLKKFLMDRGENCDLGLILFGGEAKHFVSSNPDKCYSRRFVDSIGFMFDARGTAIGDAIWLAKNSYAKNHQPKKLVIIGDGDNTAGHIAPKLAATLARKYNIVIYTIGVGTTGLVPFGVDSSGKPNMIDNTFIDKDFKIISSVTNGKYYWAKDEHELSRILKMIFQ